MKYRHLILWLIGITIFHCPIIASNSGLQPIINPSLKENPEYRKQLINELLTKYNQNLTFANIHQYQINQFIILKKQTTPIDPDLLFKETLERTSSIFEKIKPFLGNNHQRIYDPEKIKNSFNRYVWLKGFCFFILGISEEHKIFIAYFYQPGNEELKQQFIREIVRYSYPEVEDIPENETWFQSMSEVMGHIGYQLFNIQKYCSTEDKEL